MMTLEMDFKIGAKCICVRFDVHFKFIVWQLLHDSTFKQQANNGLVRISGILWDDGWVSMICAFNATNATWTTKVTL